MRRFSKKVVKKIKNIGTKLIPHNTSYKPTGVYTSVKEYISSFGVKPPKSIEVYPEYTSSLAISDDFYNKCSDYIHQPKTISIRSSVIAEIPQGRLHTDTIGSVAIISHDNKVIGEISYQMGKDKPEDNSIFEQSYFTVPKKYKGVVFHLLIGGSGDNNYFHWLIDALPRIHLLHKSGWFNKVDWFVVPSYKQGYQADTLRLLGIDEKKIIEGHKETHIEADVLIASTFVRYYGHIPVWACDFLRKYLLQTASSELNSYSYVYISRNDSNKRNVLNEKELVSMLEEYGFKKFELGRLSFQEQVSLFASAKVILSPHGAGLANLLFCQEGTTIIEMFANQFVIPLYYDLATKVGLNYDYITCQSDGTARNVREGMRTNIIVDLDALKIKLDRIMESYAGTASKNV